MARSARRSCVGRSARPARSRGPCAPSGLGCRRRSGRPACSRCAAGHGSEAVGHPIVATAPDQRTSRWSFHAVARHPFGPVTSNASCLAATNDAAMHTRSRRRRPGPVRTARTDKRPVRCTRTIFPSDRTASCMSLVTSKPTMVIGHNYRFPIAGRLGVATDDARRSRAMASVAWTGPVVGAVAGCRRDGVQRTALGRGRRSLDRLFRARRAPDRDVYVGRIGESRSLDRR
jgi:hypothetical protein